MKNMHYYIVTLVVLLFMVAPAKAASEAEFGKLHKTYILHTDGSQEMRVQKELTLFTHTAMNRLYGESFIVYNPEFQELKIHESYTRQKDGNIVKTPENAFVEVLPSAAADAPAYNGLKEMVVVHTGLELGATIYLDYSVITRPGYLPELDVCEQIEELSPIREYVLSVSVPENKPLHYELLNGKAVPVVKTAGGVKTVTWALKNVQPRPSMLAVSLPAGNVQAIVASTYASKADALKVIKRQFESNDKEVSELAKRLTANTQSSEQKTKQLTAYVQGLGNCRLSLSQTGYRLRPVAEVIRSAYGTEAEKAALLAALQQASGIQAEVKAVFPKTEDKDAAGLAAVSRLFVADNAIADIQDFVSVVNMDASKADALKVIKRQFESNDKEVSELAKRLTANTQSSEQKTKQLTAYVQGLGNCRLSLSQTGYRLRPVAEVIRSAYGTEAEKAALLAALQQASGIQAEVKAVFPKTEDKDAAGLAAVSRLFVADNAIADIQDFVSVVNMDARPVTLEGVSHVISQTDTLRVTAEAGKTLEAGYRKFELPQARNGWAAYEGRSTVVNTTRPVNLLLRYLPDETYTCIVKVADGMRPVVLPTDKKIDNPVGTVGVTVKKAAKEIKIVRTLKLKKQLITPAEYPAYYRLMSEWLDTGESVLLF